jgi:D-beta-D-heptose 7-phosphate kinase/D-beta-D-heptose 1-phosphate adenosyltransferase
VNADVPVILDPKAFDLTAVGPVAVITPNEREAEKFSGHHVDSDTSADVAGRVLIERTGARNILITRGENGMSLISADGEIVHMPTQSKEVYDVTGAGDTVVAVLALVLAAGAYGLGIGQYGRRNCSRQDGYCDGDLEELESALGSWPNVFGRCV